MSIDINVYGSNFVDDYHGTAKTTSGSLWSYYLNGNLTINELPNDSACYCGMYYDNYFINANLCNPDKTFTPVFVNDKSANSWFLMRNYDRPAGRPYGQSFSNFGTPYNKIIKWDATTLGYYAECTNRFIFNLQLKNILFIPYVVCSSSNTYAADTITVTLAAYAAAEHTTKPYINGVYMKPYYNAGTAESPNWTSFLSYNDFAFFTPIAMFTDDFKALFTDFEYSTCIFTTTAGTGDFKNYIPVLGFGSQSKRDLLNNSRPVAIDPEPSHYIYDDNDNPTHIKYILPYTEDNLKLIYKQIAYFGVFFLGDGAGDFNNVSLISSRVFCGTIEEDGITRGNYTRGTENANQLSYQWDDTSRSPYDPSKLDPNIYDDGFIFPNEFTIGISGINNRYLLRSSNIITLSNALWDFTKNLQPEEVTDNINKTFLTNNPIDLIIALQYLPVKDISFGTDSAVMLGRLNLGISAPSVKACKSFECGYINIFPTFGDNWISKQIRIFAYLPFCGTMEIDNESVMGKNLYLRYLVDTYTGSCTAVLYIVGDRDKNIIINTADGNCITDIPVTGIQWETLNANLFNAYQQNKQLRLNTTFNVAKALTGFGSSVAAGDVTGATMSGLNVASVFTNSMTAEKLSDYNLSHTQIPMRTIGASSGITSNLLDVIPKLIFYRPIDKGSEEFTSTEGLACLLNGSINDLSLSGYTEISKIDLNGISATAAEKQMIRNICASGIYI